MPALRGFLAAGEEAFQFEDACVVVQIKRQRPEESPVAQQLYKEWVGGTPLSSQAVELLHTQYHKRDKSLASAVKDW